MKILTVKFEYADDYKNVEYTDANGKIRKRAEYIGPYIPFRGNPALIRKKNIIVAVLTGLLTLCLGYTELMQHASAAFAGVSIPLAVALFPCFYLITAMFSLSYDAKPMKRDRYHHGILRAFHSCGAIIPLVAVTFIADFVYRAISGDWMYLDEDVLFDVLIVAVLVFSIGIVMLLRSVVVDERDMNIYEAKLKKNKTNKF